MCPRGLHLGFLHFGNGISEYVARLSLSQATELFENWFEFFIDAFFFFL